MHWLALYLPEALTQAERQAWCWRALRLTPRVAQVDEALVLEVSTSLRLWRGSARLLRRLLGPRSQEEGVVLAQGATHLVAIALLRLQRQGLPLPALCPQQLPLDTLSAAQPHAGTLARMGCTTWGDVRALPRSGVARRFGAALLDALDTAWGERPAVCTWLLAPEVFDVQRELPALATTAPELMWTAQRLLALLQDWLRARQQGVLALQLEWTLDLKRLDGVVLPPTQSLTVRTAQPAQGMAHLRRLVGEHLARTTLAAPANALRLRSLQTAPWAGSSASLLPQELREGERLHELVERLRVRLGDAQVAWPHRVADHRPERMQRWLPVPQKAGASLPAAAFADALLPAWLLREPLPLALQGSVPCFHGPLQILSAAQRIEGGWWDTASPAGTVLRDYFMAESAGAGLVWIYRERANTLQQSAQHTPRWFLHGLYA